jgi:hypothetical protein
MQEQKKPALMAGFFVPEKSDAAFRNNAKTCNTL